MKNANNTPLKINMEHNNGGLEDDFPFQLGDFQVNHVNLPGCMQKGLTFWLRYAIVLAQIALYCAVLIPFLSDKVYGNAFSQKSVVAEKNSLGKNDVAQMVFKCGIHTYTMTDPWDVFGIFTYMKTIKINHIHVG